MRQEEFDMAWSCYCSGSERLDPSGDFSQEGMKMDLIFSISISPLKTLEAAGKLEAVDRVAIVDSLSYCSWLEDCRGGVK